MLLRKVRSGGLVTLILASVLKTKVEILIWVYNGSKRVLEQAGSRATSMSWAYRFGLLSNRVTLYGPPQKGNAAMAARHKRNEKFSRWPRTGGKKMNPQKILLVAIFGGGRM